MDSNQVMQPLSKSRNKDTAHHVTALKQSNKPRQSLCIADMAIRKFISCEDACRARNDNSEVMFKLLSSHSSISSQRNICHALPAP